MFEKLLKILAELIAAINANTAAIQANAGSVTEEEGQAADADDSTEEPAEEEAPAEEPAEEEPAEEPEPEEEKPKAKKATKPAPAAKADTTSGPTLNDLRAVASELLGQGKGAAIKTILAKYKTESLTKLDEKHYAAVLAALKKL